MIKLNIGKMFIKNCSLKNINKYKKITILGFVLLLNLIVLTGCARNELFIPELHHLSPAPYEVTTDQIVLDYLTDEVSADAKYKDKRLLFSNVEVEGINTVFVDSVNSPFIYILNNSVEFRPRYDADTSLIREGFVVDIVGEVRGFFGVESQYLIVDDCWVGIIEGDIEAAGNTFWGY